MVHVQGTGEFEGYNFPNIIESEPTTVVQCASSREMLF
jgi:hypothetical protein